MNLDAQQAAGAGEFRLASGPDWTAPSAHLEKGVTIVLRTKDRPLLLRRALASIAAQQFSDLTLCLVNDGGDAKTVESILQSVLPKTLAVDLVHHGRSVGQPAALNAGFARVTRRYFAVHDDDDTWYPLFLKKMVGFLEEPRNRRFIGAVCYADQITETWANGSFIAHRRRPFHRHAPVLSLIDLLVSEIHPPPISHLMRHAALAVAGEMNLELPVMYDFEWTVRLLRQADIATVPEVLAFYHLRDTRNGSDRDSANSVFEFKQEYGRLNGLLRNQLLREELSRGSFGLGYLSSLVHMSLDRQRTDFEAPRGEIFDYLAQRARRHARLRKFRRYLEAPFRSLRDKWQGR